MSGEFSDQTVQLEKLSKDNRQGFVVMPPPFKARPVEGVLTIGRAPTNNIRLQDPYVSLHHCQIEQRPTGFYVRDLKSRNGVKVNGVRVSEGELVAGSEIQLGSVILVFQNHDPSDTNRCPLTSKNKFWNAQLEKVPPFAKSDLPIFIQGESGSGKEVLAKTIHDLSSRSKRPLVSVNCSALTESLVESELFGHMKGAFTGATADRKGAFENARNGTLFLDEIGDLPLSLQPKLLRAIENNEIRPLGSDVTIETNVRIVSATHKNLENLVNEGLFRSDLYFRIHVIKLTIPPLRQRMEDFDDLFYVFCKEFRLSFSVEAITELKNHIWPGNIRELRNTIARAKALFPQTRLYPDHLKHILTIQRTSPATLKSAREILDGSQRNRLPMLKELEREMIRARLLANGNNQRRTAMELGIPKSTLHDRIKAYGIDIENT